MGHRHQKLFTPACLPRTQVIPSQGFECGLLAGMRLSEAMRSGRIEIGSRWLRILLNVSMVLPGFSGAAQTAAHKQVPVTAPQVREVLPSYEGQRVLSLEVAGRPELDPQQVAPLLAQHEGEPFARAKIDQTISALKDSGQAKEVEVEIRPQANGIRVLLVLQPAIYFGIFEFPGTIGKFPYSRLLEVSDYPPRGAYTPVDVQNAQASLVKFFQQNGYFESQVRPEIQTDTAHTIANVIFHVKLNRHAKFGKVILKGAPPDQGAGGHPTKSNRQDFRDFRYRCHLDRARDNQIRVSS